MSHLGEIKPYWVTLNHRAFTLSVRLLKDYICNESKWYEIGHKIKLQRQTAQKKADSSIFYFLFSVAKENKSWWDKVSAGWTLIFDIGQTSSCSVSAIPPNYCPSGSSIHWWPEIHPLCPTKQKQWTMCSRLVRAFFFVRSACCGVRVLTGAVWITGSNGDSLIWLLSDSDCWTQKSDLAQRGPLFIFFFFQMLQIISE